MLDKPPAAELHFALLQVLLMSRNKVSWPVGLLCFYIPLLYHKHTDMTFIVKSESLTKLD